jgi:hypothetical protein
LKNIRRHGRVFEGELMAEYLITSGQIIPKFKDGTLMDDMKLGINLLRKGKMSVIPKIHKGRKFVTEVLKD